MRKTTLGLLAGAATLMAAGAAYAAARDHVMNVPLPDGSVMQVHYQGDVAPRVLLTPTAVAANDPFVEMDRMFAAMAAEHEAMLQQVAAMQHAVASPGQMPAGSVFHMVQTSTDGRGCTQTVEWSSDGTNAQPKVTQASAGNCDAAKPAPTVPATEVREQQAQAPGHKV
ncbi:MAG: hypothetical protein KGM17_11165 [Sphingomonadales bacterium]|nr:hypothetical protein [Sphingomonadales bacterium]